MDKIIDNLYLGDLKSAQDPEWLGRFYITHIVTLDKNLAPMYPKKYTYYTVPILDEPTENIAKHFNSVCTFAKKAIRRDSANVLIHCTTGNSLSVCFVTAYLIKIHDYLLKDALKLIKKIRPKIKPHPIFLSQV